MSNFDKAIVELTQAFKEIDAIQDETLWEAGTDKAIRNVWSRFQLSFDELRGVSAQARENASIPRKSR